MRVVRPGLAGPSCRHSASMSPLVAILIAVAMHVTWNLFARHTRPDAEFLWWAVGGHLLLFALDVAGHGARGH